MQSMLNLKVKRRESFRPFAPAVLREEVARWFDLDRDSPYMLLVAEGVGGGDGPGSSGSAIPAAMHVDRTARVQTVHRETNPRFHELIRRFGARTRCPVLVNTSFNVRGEPIVCTPEDGLRCFMGTDIEVLAVGNCLLRKADQDRAASAAAATAFEPD